MKKFSKELAACMALAMLVSFASGCDKGESSGSPVTTTSQTTTATSATEETTETTAETTTEATTAEAATTEATTTTEAPTETTEEPTTTTTEAPYVVADPVTVKNVSIGSIVTLGNYEGEDVEWIVLDKKDDALLLMTRYVIEQKSLNENYGDYDWASCNLRTWLNKDFMESAFASGLRNYIRETELDNEKDGSGANTKDKIFILNSEEAAKYLKTDKERMCRPTGHAVENNVWVYNFLKKTYGNCYWWLRSVAQPEKKEAAQIVGENGKMSMVGYGASSDFIGIRPVMWIESAGISSEMVRKAESAPAIEFEIGADIGFGGDYLKDWHWIVLDKTEDSLLLISSWAFNASEYSDSTSSCMWKNSLIRKVVNEDFINWEFKDKDYPYTGDLKRIKTTKIKMEDGSTISDKVFILSAEEAEKYKDIFAKMEFYEFGSLDQKASWLRTPGTKEGCQATFSQNGKIDLEGQSYDSSLWCHPVVWIDVSDLVG